MSVNPTPFSSIKTDYPFGGDTVNVFFGPDGFIWPKDAVIDPGELTVPISEGFNDYEKAQFRFAFDIIEQYIGLSFEIVTNSSNANFFFLLDTDQFTGNTAGYAYLPDATEQYGVF